MFSSIEGKKVFQTCLTQQCMLMNFHSSTDLRKSGTCAADLLWQWPEGWGLWNFLDVQSCRCHEDCPIRLCCQQRLWRYIPNMHYWRGECHFSYLSHCSLFSDIYMQPLFAQSVCHSCWRNSLRHKSLETSTRSWSRQQPTETWLRWRTSLRGLRWM